MLTLATVAPLAASSPAPAIAVPTAVSDAGVIVAVVAAVLAIDGILAAHVVACISRGVRGTDGMLIVVESRVRLGDGGE